MENPEHYHKPELDLTQLVDRVYIPYTNQHSVSLVTGKKAFPRNRRCLINHAPSMRKSAILNQGAYLDITLASVMVVDEETRDLIFTPFDPDYVVRDDPHERQLKAYIMQNRDMLAHKLPPRL